MARRRFSLLAALLVAVLAVVLGATSATAQTEPEPSFRGPAVTTRTMAWNGGGVMNPYRGVPTDVSCPTATWCMAVDQFGESVRWNGSAWTGRQRAAGSTSTNLLQFRSVSCPTTTFCLAVMNDRRLAEWRGAWTVKKVDLDYDDVSCWSTTDCGLTTSWHNYATDADFARWRSGSVVAKVVVPGRSGGVGLSCPTSMCFFLTAAGSVRTVYVHRMTGTSAYATTALGEAGLNQSVSCVSTTWCMATLDDRFRTLSGATWSATRDLADIQGFDVAATDVSCASASACAVVGQTHSGHGVGTWNGRAWTVRTMSPSYNAERAVDCATATQCMVVDNRGRASRWTGSSWTAMTSFDPARGGLSSLECPTSSFCTATDGHGNVMEWTPTRGWTWMGLSENASVLDCPTTWCMSVSPHAQSKRVRTSAGWQPTRGDWSLGMDGAFACPTSTRCFDVSGRWVRTFSATSTQSTEGTLPVDLGGWVRGDCPTATYCLFVGDSGRAVSWNGSTWSSRGLVPGGLGYGTEVDCLSPSHCVVNGFRTAVLTPTAWRVIGSEPMASVSCRTTSWCFALGQDHVLRVWDGRSWTTSGPARGSGLTGDAKVRCAPAGRCMVVVEDQAWWTA